MRVLSATEAITPAIDRTKALLQPFALGRWLKLGLVALLAEMSGQFAFPPVGGNSHAQQHFDTPLADAAGGAFILAIALIVLLGLILSLVLFYFGSRMQLVLMDLVATRTTLVAPAWHRTASRTWRWIGLKVAFFFAALVVIGILLAVPLLSFIRSMPADNSQPPSAAFFGSFALFFVAILLAVLAVVLVFLFLRDFVLPFILFGDARLGDAMRNAVFIARREPGSVVFYFFMKFVLMIAAGIAVEICLALAVVAFGIPTGAIGAALWFMLRQSGPLAHALMYISFALLGAVFLTALVCAILCIASVVLIFYQSYALYFLGGRYPQLGEVLEPPPPPPPGPEFTYSPA